MTFWYLLLTLIFSVFNPEIGSTIANAINNALNSDMSGLGIWITGLIIAIIVD